MRDLEHSFLEKDSSNSTTNFSEGKLHTFKKDFFAGVAVFFVAIPLCLGIALASSAPLASGLLAGIVGGILVGYISGSHTSVSGPAAGLTAVVAAQIFSLGSFPVFLVALIIAGLIQVAMGTFKLGFIAVFFPSSVIKGLLTAIGIILILKQVPHLVGWDRAFEGEMAFVQPDHENTFSELGNVFFNFHTGALLVGLISLAILIAWDKISWLKNLQIYAYLVVVGVGIASNAIFLILGDSWFISSEHRVQVPMLEDISGFINFLAWPEFSALLSPAVYVAGVTIAIVASLETLLNLSAVDKIDPQQRVSSPNRELIAQGIGNAVLGLIGGIPVTSVIIRSSVNINSGSKTKASAIIHGFMILFCVLLAPKALNMIPLSCLAAILILTGFKLASYKIMKQVWLEGSNQFLPFTITVVSIVLTDLLTGVLIGLIMGILFVLNSNLRRPMQLIEEQHASGKVYRLALANQVSFLNRGKMTKMLESIPSSSHVLLDASQTHYIDSDILGFIKEFKDTKAPLLGIQVSLVGFKEKYRLANVIQFQDYFTPELQKSLTPSQALQIFKNGNMRVLTGKRLQRDLNHQIEATSKGQFPFGVVLSCIDSRAPVELIFDLGIGDVFSIRMAGNVVSQKVLGSLEFACAIAGAKIVLVMGHTRCGAVSAAIDFFKSKSSVEDVTQCQNLSVIIRDIHRAIPEHHQNEIPKKNENGREAYEEQVVRLNVIESIKRIREESSTLNNLIEAGKIAIAGCVYDVCSGKADFISEYDANAPVYVNDIESEPFEKGLVNFASSVKV